MRFFDCELLLSYGDSQCWVAAATRWPGHDADQTPVSAEMTEQATCLDVCV